MRQRPATAAGFLIPDHANKRQQQPQKAIPFARPVGAEATTIRLCEDFEPDDEGGSEIYRRPHLPSGLRCSEQRFLQGRDVHRRRRMRPVLPVVLCGMFFAMKSAAIRPLPAIFYSRDRRITRSIQSLKLSRPQAARMANIGSMGALYRGEP